LDGAHRTPLPIDCDILAGRWYQRLAPGEQESPTGVLPVNQHLLVDVMDDIGLPNG
jgi:hypothetical protein